MRVVGYVGRQELQRDKAAQFGIFGLVDDAHPTAAKFFDDAVMRDGSPGHWAEILGLETTQVNETGKVGCSPSAQIVEKSQSPVDNSYDHFGPSRDNPGGGAGRKNT